MLSNNLQDQIAEVKYVTITADAWTKTSNTRSFLGVTAHYITTTNFFYSAISLKELDASQTAEYLNKRLFK